MAKKIISFILLLLFALSNSKLEENLEQLQMKVDCRYISSHLYGQALFGRNESRIFYKTDYFDNSNIFDQQNIEAETQFQTTIEGQYHHSYVYTLSCRLWKGDDNGINSICSFEGQVDDGAYILNNSTFVYRNKYNITIIFECRSFTIVQYDFNISYLYAQQQVININNNDNDFFELKFNIELYNNEKLILIPKVGLRGLWESAYDLENCEKINKQLICKISKEQILKHANSKELYYYLITVIKEPYFYFYYFEGVDLILIKNNIKKKNIYVKITKLLKKVTEIWNNSI